MENIEMHETRQKVQYAKDCEYFVKRMLDPCTPINQDAEERRRDDSEFEYHLYFFKENFCKFIGEQPIGFDLEEYKKEALDYLNCSFPFCFRIELGNSLASNIGFFAMCLGADENQLKGIKDLLKGIKMHGIDPTNKRLSRDDTYEREIDIDTIEGSTVAAYQGNNLFEVLSALEDKGVSRYMEYVMLNGGLENPGKAFDGIGLSELDDGKILVSEGNHRVMTYKMLKAIKEFITGKKVPQKPINANVQRVKLINDYGDFQIGD